MLATLAILSALSTLPVAAAATSGSEVDVELVLAVDTSRSMDDEEMRVQRQGYLQALQHPDFINAVRGGLIGKIAITYFEWAGEVDRGSVVDWQVIETAEDAAAFADKLAARPIQSQRRTSISAAIAFGAEMLTGNAYQGMRQVIDVSGDGPNNVGQPVEPVRNTAVESGIIINGLALMLRPSGTATGLDRYYGDCVIGGPGSFVLPVHDIADFATAVRRKLVLEVSGVTPDARFRRIAAEPKVDCMMGEMQWRDFMDR
ncbi:DUF1194 domain-containing protein [Rhizobium sp. SSA_523]|uniref:DUF1194 domain-containing protein n=1 Tax=Rhizobium sp. SSA_523 TaxID=2952477 RepID=UPI002091B702|nr:DUF1194 domain-containing protein [Rhizobium sp. SSA_523]MCO5732273.1 DUF1194 domain-containing protein [Rhizobium sp. SSA_523]WKC22514.1 DUF1194 domain-containing protein [Rhizobium sp. SSA_523]